MLKVLNLYAGIGGNRKLWEDVEVTAVEHDEWIAATYQKFFPNDNVVVADAHKYLLEHYKEFDFIWASPPCPTHSKISINFAIRFSIFYFLCYALNIFIYLLQIIFFEKAVFRNKL